MVLQSFLWKFNKTTGQLLRKAKYHPRMTPKQRQESLSDKGVVVRCHSSPVLYDVCRFGYCLGLLNTVYGKMFSDFRTLCFQNDKKSVLISD